MHRVLVIGVALLAGCGDKKLEHLEDVKDRVCACKTVECGEAAMKDVPQGDLKSGRKMQRVAGEMVECMAKLHDQARVPTDPDADVPPDAAP